MPVVRDPDTGKFVSVDDPDHHHHQERETVSGFMVFDVDPADLSTGVDTFNVEGSDAIVLDFSSELDHDEVFVLDRLETIAQVDPERTATAEHLYDWRYFARVGTGDAPDLEDEVTVGAVQVQRDQREEDSIIHAGTVVGSGDFADSTNGLGGGADQRSQHHVIEYSGLDSAAPSIDEDDEISLPSVFRVNGSDDQGLRLTTAMTAIGTVVDIG